MPLSPWHEARAAVRRDGEQAGNRHQRRSKLLKRWHLIGLIIGFAMIIGPAIILLVH